MITNWADNWIMLLAVLALVIGSAMIAALVHAVHTASDGREDAEGFHYVPSEMIPVSARSRATAAERESAVITSGPAA